MSLEQYDSVRSMASEIHAYAPDAGILTTYYCGNIMKGKKEWDKIEIIANTSDFSLLLVEMERKANYSDQIMEATSKTIKRNRQRKRATIRKREIQEKKDKCEDGVGDRKALLIGVHHVSSSKVKDLQYVK
ncbi:hypothetical protein OROGR_026233 [Orobanche gracilis]